MSDRGHSSTCAARDCPICHSHKNPDQSHPAMSDDELRAAVRKVCEEMRRKVSVDGFRAVASRSDMEAWAATLERAMEGK